MCIRRVGECCVAGITHNAQSVAGFDDVANLSQQLTAMAEVQIIHGIRGLVRIKAHTNVITPLPCPVGMVGDDAGRNYFAANLFTLISGHIKSGTVQKLQIDTTVPNCSVASGIAIAGIPITHTDSAVSNSKSHVLSPLLNWNLMVSFCVQR